MASSQPRVVVQLANGDALDNDDDGMGSEQFGPGEEYSGVPENGSGEEGRSLAFESPPSGMIPAAPAADETDSAPETASGEENPVIHPGQGNLDRVHPPSSPSPPPSMTPPDHLHLVQPAPPLANSQHGTSSSTTTVYASGSYTTVRNSPVSSSSSLTSLVPIDSQGNRIVDQRPVGRPIAPAPPASHPIPNSGSAGTVTTVVLATGNSPVVVSNNSSSSHSAAAVSGSPAIIVGTPAGQSPGQAAVQSDHCYGLPYQDHNYGGPAIVPGTGQVSTPGGRPPYPFKVRYPAGYLALQGRDRSSTLSGSEGDAPENFPVIGGLERYLNDEATEPETSPAPNAAVPISRPVAGDSIAITTYHGRSGGGAATAAVATNGSASREPQYSTSSTGSVPYYQRYISPVDYANQSGSPAYSQHLVQIGGRTYIRQTTGPPPAAAGVGNGPLFRNRQDYIGINNPPVLIPPYGGRGRGAQKRAGRPRIARNVSGSIGTYSSSNIATAGASPGMGGPSYSSSIVPGAETGHAPMIAPSKGGRPPGRGRGGARRRTVGTPALANNQITNATNSSLPPIKSPDEEKQEKDAFAGLLIDYEKRYDELLNRPLAGSGTGSAAPASSNATATPRSYRGRGRAQRPPNVSNSRGGGSKTATPPTNNNRPQISQAEMTPESGAEQIMTPPSLPKVTVEQINNENGYITQRMNDSPEVGPMTALTEQEEDHPVPEPMKEEEPQETSHQSESAVSSDEETSSTDTDVEGEWDGTDYVTRCLCGMQHNDEFMISCDKCEVWQHCRCMGIDTRRIPESYLCEKCDPRPLKLSAEKAREFQVKKLEKRAKEKEKRRQAREKRRAQRKKTKAKRKADLNAKKETEDLILPKQKAMDTYHEVSTNDYTDESKKFIQLHGDTLGYNLLEQISENVCQAMYVAPGKWGLVTARTVPPNQPVAEYRGRICLKSECSGRDKLGRVMTYTLMYSGFPVLSGQIDASGGQDTVCVDARLKGSAARFVRRSCRPNTQVKHVIKAGELHLLLVSTELVERGTEVTIPFDFDFRSSKYNVDCACATTPSLPAGSPMKDGVNSPGAAPGEAEENPCPIQEHNRHLEARKGVDRVRKRQSTETSEGGRRKRPSITAAQPTTTAESRKTAAPKTVTNSQRKRKTLKTRGRGGGVNRRNVGTGAKGGGGLKVKLAERAKSAVKKAKAGYNNARNRHSQRQAKSRGSPAKASDGESKPKTNELKALKQDFWSSNESPTSPPSRTRALSERSPSDEDSRKLSREERKLQGLLSRFQKLEEAEKRKGKDKSEVEKKPASPIKNKKVTISPKKRRTRRWRKGQEKGAKRNRRKDSKKQTSEDRESESDIKSETEDDEEDEGSAGGASGGSGNSTSGPTTRQASSGGNTTPGSGGRSGSDHNLRGPPRKRWASSSAGATNASPVTAEPPPPEEPRAPPVRNTPQSGGTKKRWLRQAMSEDHGETTTASPRGVAAPPKKRLRNGSETVYEQPPGENAISTAEAATVLTQMGLPSPGSGYPGAPIASQGEVVETDTPASPEMQPPVYENPLTESFSTVPMIPAEVAPEPIKKRKKVSLDEYKKRKAAPHPIPAAAGDSTVAPAHSPPGDGQPKCASVSQQPSFIPQMTETDILASGRSFRLGNLPDPEKFGRGTATIEDLKQRIYGRKFIEGQAVPPPEISPPLVAGELPQQFATSQPPPPPPEEPKPANRMSLADRLRTEFGLDSDPDPQAELNPAVAAAVPTPIPPQGLPYVGAYPPAAQISHAPPASIQYHGPPGFPAPPPPSMATIPEMAPIPPHGYPPNLIPPPGSLPQVRGPLPPRGYPGSVPPRGPRQPVHNGTRVASAELDDSFEDDRDEGMGPGGYIESRTHSDSSSDERGKKRLKSASEEGEISSSDGGDGKWSNANRQKRKRKLQGSRSRSRSPPNPAAKRRGALSEYPYSGPNRYQGSVKSNRSYRSFDKSRTEERGY